MDQSDYENSPATLNIREIKIGKKVLITTLQPKDATKNELKALYAQRWHIEVDFRHIKTTMGMNELSCKSPEMNQKEIWVYFLAYNLIRILMAQAALLANLLPRQLSFKHCLQLWIAWTKSHEFDDAYGYQKQLFVLMAAKQVGKRPNRIEPRAVKKRPKPFALLMVPREQAREQIRIHGHPKKLK